MSVTSGLHSEGHVMSGVVSSPELLQALISIYHLLLWFMLQSLGIS